MRIAVIILFVIDIIFGAEMWSLHNRIEALEQEVYIRKIVDEATLKEGDGT